MHGISKFLRRPLLDWSRVYSARSDGWGLAPLFLDQRIDIPTRLADLRLALSVPLALC